MAFPLAKPIEWPPHMQCAVCGMENASVEEKSGYVDLPLHRQYDGTFLCDEHRPPSRCLDVAECHIEKSGLIVLTVLTQEKKNPLWARMFFDPSEIDDAPHGHLQQQIQSYIWEYFDTSTSLGDQLDFACDLIHLAWSAQ